MPCILTNKSDLDINKVLPLLKSLYSHAHKEVGFNKPPNITFQSDPQNAGQDLGKTGHYDPASLTITVYTDRRHIKDVLRSVAHELIHHDQNCCGAFEEPFETGPGYAQKDDRMRELERDAYERGNMIFRDWEDTYKQALNETNYYRKETPKMSKGIKEQELRQIVRKVLKERLIKKAPKPSPKAVAAVVEEQPSNDEWYGNTLYESLKRKWTK